MKKYRIGIIGYGGFGTFLHYWWARLDAVQVVAVANSGSHFPDAENCRAYQNWKDLIADPEIDIVSIVTPPGLHAEMACQAMLAGKHVLLEKPVALTVESARQLLEVQRKTGKEITVNHMIRYNPLIKTLTGLGKSGRFGALRHVVVNNYAQDASLPPGHWFWDKEMSGGILVEHGVHFFDIVNAISGQHFTKVYGTSHSRNAEQHDRVAAMVKYDKGLIAHYYHAFSGPGLFEQTSIHLAYDLARIDIDGWMPMKGTVRALVGKTGKSALESLDGWNLNSSEKLHQSSDISRPEGWGDGEAGPVEAPGYDMTFCGGVAYDVDEIVSGTFGLAQTKGEVYGQCVQSILLDLIQRIENPEHRLQITIEDAVTALEIAVLASE